MVCWVWVTPRMRGLTDVDMEPEITQIAFWSLNIGDAWWRFLSLLPQGILQTLCQC